MQPRSSSQYSAGDDLSHHFDTIRLALAPYCCGPGESFRLEPIRDIGTYLHDDTCLLLDMVWEPLRGLSHRDGLRLMSSLCDRVLSTSDRSRIVMFNGVEPSLWEVKQILIRQKKEQEQQEGSDLEANHHLARSKLPPSIQFMLDRAEKQLPLLPGRSSPVAVLNQNNLVPVTRCLKNGTEVIYGYRELGGKMVMSFDPIVTSDETHNRKRRSQRRADNTQKPKVSRQGWHCKPRSNTTPNKAG